MNFEKSKEMFIKEFDENTVFFGCEKENDVLIRVKMLRKLCEQNGLNVKYLTEKEPDVVAYHDDFTNFVIFISQTLLPTFIELFVSYIKTVYLDDKGNNKTKLETRFNIRKPDGKIITHASKGNGDEVIKSIKEYEKWIK